MTDSFDIILGVLLFACLIFGMREFLSNRTAVALAAAENSDVVRAAALFWTQSLCQDFQPKLEAVDLENFYNALRRSIALEYIKDGLCMLDFGMTSRAPMGFVSRPSADPLFYAARDTLTGGRGLIRELAAYMPLMEMRINEGVVKLRSICRGVHFSEWEVVYRAGEDVNVMAALGEEYRPAALKSDEDLLAA